MTFVSLDGVMQAPGGPEEDTSNHFALGGWTFPYFDETLAEAMAEQMGQPFDLLLGRKTYDIFAAYWPHSDEPGAELINDATKYVVSHQDLPLEWQNSVLLNGDVARQIKKLKRQAGPPLQVHGSGNLIQTLLTHDLVDELWLKIFPITIGTGKRLFAEGTIPAAFKLTDSQVTPKGVIIANYKRAGNVKTGSFA